MLTDLGELALLALPAASMEALAFLDTSFPAGSGLPEHAHIRALLERVLLLLPQAEAASFNKGKPWDVIDKESSMCDAPHKQAPQGPDALAELAAAAEGLLVMSESDYPLTPLRWPGPGPLTPETLLAHLGLPPDTPVETRSLDAFLGPMAAEREWFDDAQRETAAHFARLRDLFDNLLTDVRVYRVGHVQITTVIAGEDAEGSTVGLQTTQIET